MSGDNCNRIRNVKEVHCTNLKEYMWTKQQHTAHSPLSDSYKQETASLGTKCYLASVFACVQTQLLFSLVHSVMLPPLFDARPFLKHMQPTLCNYRIKIPFIF